MKSEASQRYSKAWREYNNARDDLITELGQAEPGTRSDVLFRVAMTLSRLQSELRRAEDERLVEILLKAAKRNGMLNDHSATVVSETITRAIAQGRVITPNDTVG